MADEDGDGDLDVLSASAGDDTIVLYENIAGDGSAWTTHSITTPGEEATSVFALDVNGDGDLDARPVSDTTGSGSRFLGKQKLDALASFQVVMQPGNS